MSALIFIFLLFGNAAFAQSPSFLYSDLETLAKKSIDYEVNYVNEFLSRGSLDIPGYSWYQLTFLREIGKSEIDPSYLYNKCLMSEQALEASAGSTLTAQNDCVGPLINALASVKTTYNSRMWKATSHMCQMAKQRFAMRLRSATSEGRPLHLDEDTISRLSKLVFFPSDYGRPTFFKVTRARAVVILYSGLFTGSLLAVGGWHEAGVLISLLGAGTSGLALHDNLPRAQNDLRDLNFSLISKSGYQKIDLGRP